MGIIAALSWGQVVKESGGGRILRRTVEETTMDDYTVTRVSAVTAAAAAERVTAFLGTVYGWMFVGLGVTAAVAYMLAGSPAIMQTILFVGVLITELGRYSTSQRG